MADREVVERCFVETIGAVGKHEITMADQSLVAALLMAGAIHSSLEEAAADGACDEERARLGKLLSTLTDLVQRWSPQRPNDITGTLFAISDGSAVNRA